MSAKADFVVNNLSRPTGAATGAFVINLTSSTTPMALSQPKDPTLAQFTFFVSRRREDGRERFRLHMGYFESLQAAEDMLSVVREVYPQAWAGDAPGKKLRPGAAPATAQAPAAAPARAAAPPPAAPARPAAPPPVARSSPPPAAPPPVAKSAPPAAPRAAPPVAAKPVQKPVTPPPAPAFEEPFLLSDDAPSFAPVSVPVIQPPAKPVVSPAPRAAAPAQTPQKTAQNLAPKPPAPAAAAPKPAPPVARPAMPPAAAAKAAPAKPPVVAPKIAAQVTAPAFQTAPKPAAPAARAAAPQAPKAPPAPTVQMPAISQQAAALSNVRQVIEELDDLSDTQTIRLLERHSPFREGSREADVDDAIRVIKPEDSGSMLAIKAEVKRNAPVLFAVQLDWSVTPFDMAKIPPLAIFNAYTLYTTEANREGRAWYGLRLGFFSDAVSAKQVAYYVRSDFKTVSVVPVTTVEKERATDLNASRSGIYRAANIKEGPAPTPESIAAADNSGAFQLLEDDTPDHIAQDVDGEASPRFSKPAPGAAAPPPKPAPSVAPPAFTADADKKAAAKRKGGAKGTRRDAAAPADEESLDQTLEILGANSLEITNDSADNTGVRHLRVKIDKKGSKFASLIDRLSGKK